MVSLLLRNRSLRGIAGLDRFEQEGKKKQEVVKKEDGNQNSKLTVLKLK